MSFSQDTKTELIALTENAKHDCCKKMFLYGVLYSAKLFSSEHIRLITSTESLSEYVIERLKAFYKIDANLYVSERKSTSYDERKSYKITVVQKTDLNRLFSSFKYTEDNSPYEIKTELFKCQSCSSAFLRGVFVSCGTVTNPEKSYHLELSLSTKESSDMVFSMLSELGIEPKRMERGGEFVLYYKDNDTVSGFLGYIGANNAAFQLINKKIEKEFRSASNRIKNGEVANIGKTVVAARNHLSAIRKLIDSGEIENLPDELQQTARLRLEYPALSLVELASMHKPPITKSGVNHRLQKLTKYVKE